MKRIFTVMMALLLAAGSICAAAESGEATFTVANPTPMQGKFFTDLWGNATTDIDVRDLLHGCNLVYQDPEYGLFRINPATVSDSAAMETETGDHIYIFVLRDDLQYSDGTPITAWDYAFSFLLGISPLLPEIGAAPLRYQQIAGYESYTQDGGILSGIRVLDDHILSVTLDHRYLPYFHETGLLWCNPYPIAVIAPGVEVRDDGEGVYLANKDPKIREPLFTAELLRSTILDPETGYLSHPAVISGPYRLLSWDGTTAEFEINPYYKGNHKGEIPSIPRITFTAADNETMIQQLESGEIDLLNKATRADRIRAGMELAAGGGIAMARYPRCGLSFISFACERATVSEQAVRQAIAYCFDRDAVTKEYTDEFGVRADGWYGIGQWMYEMVKGIRETPVKEPEDPDDPEAAADYEAKLAEYMELNLDGLNPYGADTDRAAALLEENGWKLNEDGLREKDGIVLDLHLIYPEGNNIRESLQKHLADHLKTVGIRLIMEEAPMHEILTRWYKQGERQEDMIYLATNFDPVFDPSAHFDADGAWAYTNLADEELYEAAEALRATPPGEILTYLRRWVAFQERFNEVLPVIPVYSNDYFDFYTSELQGYGIAENITWGQAIVGSFLAENAEPGTE